MSTSPKTRASRRAAPGSIQVSDRAPANGLPTATLDRWLAGRYSWNHEDWLALLATLRTAGYAHLADAATGQALIGNYLEAHRP